MLAKLYEAFEEWYVKNYKKLMLIPVLLFLFSAWLLVDNKIKTGEFVPKGIDLKGGIEITVYTNSSTAEQEEVFKKLGATVRKIKSLRTGELLAVVIEAEPELDVNYLKQLVNETYPNARADFRIVGPAIGKNFMKSAQKAILLGFLAMGAILALTFRNPIVAVTIILDGLLNVFEALAFMTKLGIKLAPHTIAALLMLMGWSVDGEVLFDTTIFREEEGDPRKRALKAMRTDMVMSACIFATLLALYFVSSAQMVKEIAMVLILGTVADIVNTWFQSLGMSLWYLESKGELK